MMEGLDLSEFVGGYELNCIASTGGNYLSKDPNIHYKDDVVGIQNLWVELEPNRFLPNTRSKAFGLPPN